MTGAAASSIKCAPGRRGRFVNQSPRPDAAASSIKEIDRARSAAGLSHGDLVRAAGVDRETWRQLRAGERAARPATIARLRQALAGGRRAALEPPSLAMFYRLILRELARERGLGVELVLGLDFSIERPMCEEWLAAARVRRLAMYVMTVELEVTNADLARAIGCSRQNIKQARDVVEEWRDREPALDALIVKVAALARGM